jgi:hypothetical protein
MSTNSIVTFTCHFYETLQTIKWPRATRLPKRAMLKSNFFVSKHHSFTTLLITQGMRGDITLPTAYMLGLSCNDRRSGVRRDSRYCTLFQIFTVLNLVQDEETSGAVDTTDQEHGLNPSIADNEDLGMDWLSTTCVTHPATNTIPVAVEFSSCMLNDPSVNTSYGAPAYPNTSGTPEIVEPGSMAEALENIPPVRHASH